MSEPLEPAIARALACAGLRARSVRPLATIQPAASGRAVYRIEVEAGRTIKARRLNDEATARRLFEIRRELPEGFAPAFGRHGCVLLEDWIEGDELGAACPSAAQLAEAGALLASLHARGAVAGEPVHARRSTHEWRERSEQDLQSLLGARALDADAADRTRAALEQLDPGSAIFGLVHSDFCGENMVVDRAGRLRVIDNERLRVDALGFDLARCWYRWALPPLGWQGVRSAYAAAMPFREALDQLAFWQRVVLVKSAALRLRLDPARAQVPLARVRTLASAPDARAAQD
jgi:hypothetical protein